MNRYYLVSDTVPDGTTTEQQLGSLIVPDGKKWNVNELRPTLATSCTLYIYVQNERVGTFTDDCNADIQSRGCNWQLPAGTVIQVSALNADSSDHILGVEFTIDQD